MSDLIITACDTNDIELLRLVLAGEHPECREFSVEALNDGLIKASTHGYKGCAELLLDAGANIDCTDDNGEMPLTLASIHNHVTLIEHLLTKPVDVNKKNLDSLAPLHIAAIHGHKIVVKMLLAAGADISIRDYEFETPIVFAVANNHYDIVQMLLQAGSNVNDMTPAKELLIHLAAGNNSYDMCRLLIDAGACLNEVTVFDYTALHSAVTHKNLELMELFINSGADINVVGYSKETVLHVACMIGSLECVDMILNNKKFVDIDAVDVHGLTALAKAVHNDCLPIVRRLIKDGASAKCKFVNYPGHGMRQQIISFEADCPHLIAACLAEDRLEMANLLIATGQYSLQEVRDQIALLQPHQLTEEIKEWINSIFHVWPLLFMCRAAVNDALWKHVLSQCRSNSQRSLPVAEQRKENIAALPLPKEMKNFLLFSDL